jgi:mRNA-degrading endonuclease RelE of RelBE toxin-antitoxin system
MVRERNPHKFTIKDADVNEVELPKLRRGRYVGFRIYFDVERDWRIVQLIYTKPPDRGIGCLKRFRE